MSKRFAAVVCVAAAMAGCAIFAHQRVQHTEHMLAAAGFRLRLADTPAKLAHLQAMPQHVLQPLQRKGAPLYAYADAGGCKCLYLGNAKAYQNYQQIKLDQQEAQADTEAAMAGQDASIIDYDAAWDAWGVDAW